MVMKVIDQPAAAKAGKPAVTNGRSNAREITEPTVTISANRLAIASRPFRNFLWVQASQSRTAASLERLSGNGPLVDNLSSLAGSTEDGQLDPESLLWFCQNVLAVQAQEQTGSRRFVLRIPPERLAELLPDGLSIMYSEPGAQQQKQVREPVTGLTFG